ncbi:hypothetical protein [Variovorax sp. YR752]|uniref:hypothetical protein n=1 Tax=Variovorax sp. YR752 TaxID=1884383 RepID=UPI0031379EB0
MIISPPFLSQPDIPVYSEQCVSDVMPGGIVGSGAFPVSQAMAWHGGIHINAPTADEPVRAIADGTVIFRRAILHGIEFLEGTPPTPESLQR